MKKKYKKMYRVIKKPEILTTNKQIIVSIQGSGNPNNNPLFAKHIETLYKFSYSIRMSYKKEPIAGYYTYTVGPLEGLWQTSDNQMFDVNKKDKLIYEIFIVQPEFVTKEVFKQYQNKLQAEYPLMNELNYRILDEGLCGQIVHTGEFDREIESTTKLATFAQNAGYKLFYPSHHEIYISDFRKTAPDKIKTIIRYQLENK